MENPPQPSSEILPKPSASVPDLSDFPKLPDHYLGATPYEILAAAPFVYDPDGTINPDELSSDDDTTVDARFLRQVRQSKGYDVDCIPDEEEYDSPFAPISVNRGVPENDDEVKVPSKVAIREINAYSRKSYEIVKVEKAVSTRNRMYYLTIKAKEAVASSDSEASSDSSDSDTCEETFRAMVFDPLGREHLMKLLEYKRLLPTGSWGDWKLVTRPCDACEPEPYDDSYDEVSDDEEY